VPTWPARVARGRLSQTSSPDKYRKWSIEIR
jgi:hypothetical protein